MKMFTLVCPITNKGGCGRGWESPIPQGVCSRCGADAQCRGGYEVTALPKSK